MSTSAYHARRIPRIGITSSISAAQEPDAYAKWHPYRNAVLAVGGEPVALYNDVASLRASLERVDGLIFSGGEDVEVGLYGGRAAAPGLSVPNAARDAFEIALIREARALAVPTLCICRGLQLANVAFGGTLIEDVPSEMGEERYWIKHRQTAENGQARDEYAIDHIVRVEPSSALASRLDGRTSFPANSLHHQAVRVPAVDLRPVAWTSDETIEALDPRFEHPFFVCIQWHPEELLPKGDAIAASLFEGLIAAALKTALVTGIP